MGFIFGKGFVYHPSLAFVKNVKAKLSIGGAAAKRRPPFSRILT
jgi:hypothetical protein